MKKILIISYYGLNESLGAAGKSLEKLGYQIEDYPLFKYVYDKHDKKENYESHFKDHINIINPDIILWWFINIPTKLLSDISQQKTIYQMIFNWDDPFCWNDKISNIDIKNKAKYLDLAISACEGSLVDYLNAGSKDTLFNICGYDPEIFHPVIVEEKEIDVSFCCTNLYENTATYNDQYVNRKKLIDALYNLPNINFYLYGPDFLKHNYPRCYKGYANYNSLNNIFNNSKINITTHVCKSKANYLNERCSLVLGSGGLLLVDKVNSIESILGDSVIYMENTVEKIVKQIKNILSDDVMMENIRKKAVSISKNFTWDMWANRIHEKLCSIFFDETFYKRVFIKEYNSSPLLFWNDKGKLLNHIPYKFNIPLNFNYELYTKDFLIEKDLPIEYIYWHAYYNNKNLLPNYLLITNKPEKIENINNVKILPEISFEFNKCLNNIYNSNYTLISEEDSLFKLNELVKQHPYIDINEICENYLKTIGDFF